MTRGMSGLSLGRSFRNALSVLGLQTDTFVKTRETWMQPLWVKAKARKTGTLEECAGTCEANSPALPLWLMKWWCFWGWFVTCWPFSPVRHSFNIPSSYWSFIFMDTLNSRLLIMLVLWLLCRFSLPCGISSASVTCWNCLICLIHCFFPSQECELKEKRKFYVWFNDAAIILIMPKGLQACWDGAWRVNHRQQQLIFTKYEDVWLINERVND